MWIANCTMEAVPVTRRGWLGTQRQRMKAPREVLSDCAMQPATNAQYPQPAQARRIEAATETARATTSLAESAPKHMARLRKAKCKTEILVRKMVKDIAMATGVTWGFLYNHATSDPAVANPMVSTRPAPMLIQKRLL